MKNEAQVISEVLHQTIKKPMFLQNVGIEHKTSRSNMITLTAELERERRREVQDCGFLSASSPRK